MRTIELDYDEVAAWAKHWCRLQQAVKGDKFATHDEVLSINSDIFAWVELWLYAMCDSLGVVPHDIGIDHRNKRFTLVCYDRNNPR